MQNSGMMITRTGGDFVHDATLAVGTIAATGKHLFGGAADTVVAGAGVANAIKSGGGIGDVAKPIASYVKSHPILAPTAGAAATVAGGTAGFAAQVGAAHSLSHTSDEARAASVASCPTSTRQHIGQPRKMSSTRTGLHPQRAELWIACP